MSEALLLLLRLEGPLQSWGGRARWDVRDTEREPSKSGVIGLLGSALGYERGEPRLVAELHEGLRMGVRVEQEGVRLVDYHTVTDFLPVADGGYKHSGVAVARTLAALRGRADVEPATIQSYRDYLQGAAFLVVLEPRLGAAPDLLFRLSSALRAPRWPLYLGRKSCPPTRPLFEALTDAYTCLEDALLHHPVAGQVGDAPCELRVVVEGPPPAASAGSSIWAGSGIDTERHDGPVLGSARLFSRRQVREATITASAASTPGTT
jgi:CRISPR system Cascade subunit CasD